MGIRMAETNDLAHIARIHKAAFPTQFLAQYSVAFVSQFYGAHLGKSVLLVHEGRNGVDGFVSGGSSAVLSACRRDFVAKNLFLCIRETLWRPGLCCTAVRQTCGVLFKRKARRTPTADCHLRCIAVDDLAMGKGVGIALVDAFESSICDRYSVYWLFVYKDNPRGIRFYEKMGFAVEHEEHNGMIYVKRLDGASGETQQSEGP